MAKDGADGAQRIMRTTTVKTLRGFERLLLLLSLSLLFIYVAALIHGAVFRHAELHRFWEAKDQYLRGEAGIQPGQQVGVPDFRLWSAKRIADYSMTLGMETSSPLAVLRISAIQLEVPVLEGSDDFTLNRAVGHIEGTANPGPEGNVGIAGHRDGFFRGLKDIRVGEGIELVTQKEDLHYVIDEILIVFPEDVSVLQARSKPSLTLVTCYPFYYVGRAPQRFIVHASMADFSDGREGTR